jgi:hypothetical protein
VKNSYFKVTITDCFTTKRNSEIDYRDIVLPHTVVPQLIGEPKHRQLLLQYLHALFQADPNAGANFHGAQVELYAEYDRYAIASAKFEKIHFFLFFF